jgi:hypothetical protein
MIGGTVSSVLERVQLKVQTKSVALVLLWKSLKSRSDIPKSKYIFTKLSISK